MELYKKYRPKSLKHLVGQSAIVKPLFEMIKSHRIPHAILLSGPSGCGKTTIARILEAKLKCGEFIEKNCADFNGIEMVRGIREKIMMATLGGGPRVYLIDECHQLTKPAQDAFLKLLEDTPDHVYFILATTNPTKLLKTIITRCTHIIVQSLTDQSLKYLLVDVCEQENARVDEKVIEKIIEFSEGSARKSLVYLNSVIGLKSVDDQLNSIVGIDAQKQSIDLARALINKSKKWSAIQLILKDLKEEPESIRYLVLGYCSSILLGNNKSMWPRSYLLIDAFTESFMYSGKAGLVSACYAVYNHVD